LRRKVVKALMRFSIGSYTAEDFPGKWKAYGELSGTQRKDRME
jgi:hypothetical protein